MAVTQTEKMKQDLVDFDEKHETLLDYFAIIGFDNAQMRKLITELQERNHCRGNAAEMGYGDGSDDM